MTQLATGEQPPIPQDTRLIPLSQGQFAVVDAADYEWLSQWKWTALKAKNSFYAHRKTRLPNGKRGNIWMHREILGLGLSGLVTDHIDGNGLHNWRGNLRPATGEQNRWNHKPFRNNKSGHTGVQFHKCTGKWKAVIGVNAKEIHLGLFDSKEAAIVAREEAVKQYHGEFAPIGKAL